MSNFELDEIISEYKQQLDKGFSIKHIRNLIELDNRLNLDQKDYVYVKVINL